MKKTTAPKGKKAKAPVKPEPTWIKIQLTEEKEIETLNTIKALTRMNVTSKAVYEALVNYPQVCKRADGLNSELQKVNRDYEQLQNKFDTVKRAFAIVNGVEEKPREDWDFGSRDENECATCGEELNRHGECPNECEQ